MISILRIKDENRLKELYRESGIEFSENSAAVDACQNDDCLGYCLFTETENSVVIRKIEPLTDLPLADGLIRSVIHIGFQNGRDKAYWENDADTGIFSKLGFIKDAEKKELKAEKLFESCCCGK